ncbi:hypothetical protein SAMN04487898_11339 [Pedobacter sp. ok626]|uniref:DUF7689 domain-containing protein n=1 Tax=Pedobacter sp. ok626 TaxID=1761882 RepID=UPI0008817710|nr:hypothetical protein [Pedobacter sp. ok626]SDK92571.1 hypothetical protein SAMN04487898_11339 [Pedobacter sp. ok626]
MRKRLKLSFTTLEESLTLISPLEASYVLGGNMGGSALEPGASFGETISYFGSLGFSFTTDDSGNYTFTGGGTYQGPGIPLNEVIINGVRLTSADDDGSENRFSSGIQAMLSRFLDDRTEGSGTWDDGSGSSDGSGPIIVDGPGGGNGGGNPSGGGNSEDPWKRDANGNIIKTDTGRILNRTMTQDGIPKYIVEFKEIKIITTNNVEVIAYKVDSVRDADTNQLITGGELNNFKSNCHGYAYGDGDMWFLDPNMSPNNPSLEKNEMEGFDYLLSQSGLYEATTNKAEANVVTIWYTDSNGVKEAIHSGIINSEGKYVSKNNIDGVIVQNSEADFVAGHLSDTETVTITYYKRKF